ncbi:MAG: Wadjet anti-phage system protein JetD domain-containing protein [Actinomycetota bacterium]
MTTPSWTRVDEIVAVLRRRWNSGRYLRDHASGTEWKPVTLPVRAPTATELRDHLDEGVRWAERFQRDSRTTDGLPRFAIETRTVQGKGLGINNVPARIRIDTFDGLCALLGTGSDVRALDRLIEQTRDKAPESLVWVTGNPLVAIAHHEIWTTMLDTVTWIAERDTAQLYLRHIDVPGVDTKFVERHQKIVAQLLLTLLPAHRVDLSHTNFARRFGFRPKPDYTRFRVLSPQPMFPSALSELRVRTDELAALELPVGTVFVVENEVSYLAFPDVADAIVMFGEGFHLTSLEALPWLHHREIVYWGDIDTHGFAILNRLRQRFSSVQSILMDQATLLAHPTQYVSEPNPTSEPLPHLTAQERALYNDLIEDRFGHAIRLEQERVRFSLVREALAPWRSEQGRRLG